MLCWDYIYEYMTKSIEKVKWLVWLRLELLCGNSSRIPARPFFLRRTDSEGRGSVFPWNLPSPRTAWQTKPSAIARPDSLDRRQEQDDAGDRSEPPRPPLTLPTQPSFFSRPTSRCPLPSPGPPLRHPTPNPSSKSEERRPEGPFGTSGFPGFAVYLPG